LYIVGADTLGEMVLETARELGVEILGFVDDVSPEPEFLGIPIVGGTTWLLERAERDEGITAFVAIGGNDGRARVTRRLAKARARLPNLIHPRAWVAASARFGAGNLVMAQAYVGTKVVLGDGNLVFPGVCLGHHNTVGDFTFLAPGVSVGGRATIGDYAKLGMNTAVDADAAVCSGFMCPPLTRVGGCDDAR